MVLHDSGRFDPRGRRDGTGVSGERRPALRGVRLRASLLLAGALLLPGRALCVTKGELRDAAVRAANRLAGSRVLGRTWEDAPALVGLLRLAGPSGFVDPSSRAWIDLVTTAIGAGDAPISNGDYAAYAQAAMDLYRLASPTDAALREKLLEATSGPLAFADRALRTTPAIGPPAADWWIDGGFGTRFWVDDLFTQPPGLAMRGSRRDGLPADPRARDLAYEWIESYLYDHRPTAADGSPSPVPSRRRRGGPLLWDPTVSLFRHDAGSGFASYWGRGNGWAAWGLARAARYLDAPYGGGRYDEIVDRTGIREVLSRLASSLAARRSDDGGWPSDLANPGACSASETSATGLVTTMLATGINEGWLDRTAYTPVVLKALSVLLGRLDADGDLAGIQPPGTGPDCGVTTSRDPAVDVSFGVGAFLLAVSESLELPDGDLAALETVAAQPVARELLGRSWILVWPAACARPDVRLTNAGPGTVHASLRTRSAAPADPGSVDVPPGASVSLGTSLSTTSDVPAVLELRASGDLSVQPRGACGNALDSGDAAPAGFRIPVRRVGIAVPVWAALADGDATTVVSADDALLEVGASNASARAASLRIEVWAPDGTLEGSRELFLDAGGATVVPMFASRGSQVVLSNAPGGPGLVPIVFPDPRPARDLGPDANTKAP